MRSHTPSRAFLRRLRPIVERYRFHFLARDAAIPLFPGAAAMLAGLRRRVHVLAIATGQERAGLAGPWTAPACGVVRRLALPPTSARPSRRPTCCSS